MTIAQQIQVLFQDDPDCWITPRGRNIFDVAEELAGKDNTEWRHSALFVACFSDGSQLRIRPTGWEIDNG